MSAAEVPFWLAENEVDTQEALKRASRAISPVTGIVRALVRQPAYNDEPKFFHYLARLCNTSLFSHGGRVDEFSGGLSFVKERAMLKAVGEAIERYCLGIYRDGNLIRGSYGELASTALAPQQVVNWAGTQLASEGFERFRFNDHTEFRWVEGYSITGNHPMLLPAQLVYVPYSYGEEPIIRFPITTGAACGTSVAGAIYRGICEVVERDAFLITYLNRLERDQFDIRQMEDQSFSKARQDFLRYNLELYVADITSDIPIPVALSIIVDRSAIGPAVSVGLKASLDIVEAVTGSAEEAQYSRPWMRHQLVHRPNLGRVHQIAGQISSLKDRAFLWSSTSMIEQLDFLLDNSTYRTTDETSNLTSQTAVANLQTVLDVFTELGLEVLYVDVTTPDVEEIGFKVVKVIMPELQPLYLDEAFRYLGGERLYTVPKTLGYRRRATAVDELNPVPHPFL